MCLGVPPLLGTLRRELGGDQTAEPPQAVTSYVSAASQSPPRRASAAVSPTTAAADRLTDPPPSALHPDLHPDLDLDLDTRPLWERERERPALELENESNQLGLSTLFSVPNHATVSFSLI